MLKACVTLIDGSKATTEKILIPGFNSAEFMEWFKKGISSSDYQEPKIIKYVEDGNEVSINATLRPDEAEFSIKPEEREGTISVWDKDTITWKVIDLNTVTYAQYVHGALTFNLEQ
jgi:hypothetical protein